MPDEQTRFFTSFDPIFIVAFVISNNYLIFHFYLRFFFFLFFFFFYSPVWHSIDGNGIMLAIYAVHDCRRLTWIQSF